MPTAVEISDIVIAIAYFLIPAEILLYISKRRYLWAIERKSLFVGLLFFAFILLCGMTHLLSVTHSSASSVLMLKIATAFVSGATAIILLWILPEALSLPQYVHDITLENKLMKDFRGIMTAMRRDLREEAIIKNVYHKLRRVLPPHTLIDIGHDLPTEFTGSSHEVLSLPILGDLNMYLRRSRLSEALVTWLHDVCVQMKQALQQAACLRLDNKIGCNSVSISMNGGGAAADNSTTAVASSSCSSSCNGGPGFTPPPPAAMSSQQSASTYPGSNGYTALPYQPSSADIGPSEEVERTLAAEFELAKLRIRCSSVLSRVQTLVEVMNQGETTPEQKKCLQMIHEASKLDLLLQ